MNLPKVIDKVRKQTCAAIRTLIESGRTKVSTSEKELLLSLANWIGLLTIARDIPLRHVHLPLKECLLTAYETGSMISIVPFVSRVIRLTKRSRLFKPPNPWTVAILRVLAEIHNCPHIVDPIKFEIEILCNVLEIKLEGMAL
jgi:CCR4-NOT transcription complex subunit 1